MYCYIHYTRVIKIWRILFQIYDFEIGRLKKIVLFYFSPCYSHYNSELVHKANILTDENKREKKLTEWKDSREIAGVCWLQPQRQLYSCTSRYGCSPYKMGQSPEDNRESRGGWGGEGEGRVGTMSRDADSMHIPPNSCTSTVNLILREQCVALRTLKSLL